VSRPSLASVIVLAVVLAIVAYGLLVRFHVIADHTACRPPMHVVHAPDGSLDCV
jgi:hypothetical protein